MTLPLLRCRLKVLASSSCQDRAHLPSAHQSIYGCRARLSSPAFRYPGQLSIRFRQLSTYPSQHIPLFNPDHSNTMRIEKDKNGQDIVVTWALNPRGTELLAWGGSGHIFYWPGNTTEVMKLPTTDPKSIEDIEIEKRIYKCLGSHPNIVLCLRIAETGLVPVCAEHIVLKRAEHGTLRQYFLDGGTATVEERIKWSRDIANAIQYVHSHGIRHGDIGGRNILLDSSRTVLLCDFAGSGIDGKPPRVRAEEGFKHPVLEENWNGTIRSELHALGSTIYEIITSKRPHYELQDWMVHWIRERNYPHVADDHVEGWMVQLWLQEGIYPDVSNVRLGDVISKCWKGQFNSAEEVAQSIQSEIGSTSLCS